MWDQGSDLASWVDRWAGHQPEALAVEFEGARTNYEQLSRRIADVANWLHEHDVVPGDRVAWLGPNHPGVIDLLFACSRLGAIFLPLNSRLVVSEHRWILQDAEPKILIAEETFYEHAQEATQANMVYLLDDLADGRTNSIAPRVGSPSDAVLLAYTSGTTGSPKGALLAQSAVAANALNGIHAHDLTSEDRILTFLPLFHVGGLNIQTLPALMTGASVLLHRTFEPSDWLKDVEEWQPTWSLFVPATLNAVANHPLFTTTELSSLRGLMAGSSTIPEASTRPFFERGISVGQVYGATETAPTAIVMRIDQAAERPTSCGKPAT
ncbi:MAG: AMP-binding protein, partial [Acidimicrobiales bacterium]|nr:AMP-binding protein [Acidimicrobiales bacterium]